MWTRRRRHGAVHNAPIPPACAARPLCRSPPVSPLLLALLPTITTRSGPFLVCARGAIYERASANQRRSTRGTTPNARERFEDRSARRAIAHSARRATAAAGKRAGAGKRTFVGMGKKGAARITGARSVPPRRLARDTLRPSASSDQRRTRRSDCGIAQPPTHARDGTATGSPDQRVRDDGIALATRARTQNSRVRRRRRHRRRRPSAVAVLAAGSVRARRRRRRRTSEIGHAAP